MSRGAHHEITALPWMSAAGVLVGFRVTVPALPMPAGDKTGKDRKVIKTKSKADALRWGQQRRAVLIEEYHARKRGELEEKKPKSKVPTFTVHSPEWVKALKGEKVRFLVTRKTDRTCAKEIVIADQGVNQPLPLGKTVTVEFTASRSGEIRYACGMNHVAGIVFAPWGPYVFVALTSNGYETSVIEALLRAAYEYFADEQTLP